MTDHAADIDQQKERAALISVAVKLALTLGKFIAALLSGSLALLSEAGNNLADVATTLLSLYSIRAAARPADEDHQFGHGKVEAVSALIQTGFLFAFALFILIEAVKRLLNASVEVDPSPFAFAVLVVSIGVDLARWLSLRKIARETQSDALAADALNFATDIVASSFALLGLLAVSYGLKSGDALAALGVAMFVGIAGFDLGRRTIHTLVDAAPKGMSEPLRKIIQDVPGIMSVETLRLRPIGSLVYGEAAVRVSRSLSIDRFAGIKRAIKQAIARRYGNVSILVTAEPIALDDETIVERTLYIANRRHVPIHHVTVQTLGERKSVSFDAEFDGRLSLGRAHELVTALEDAVADELGDGFEVESHIEPLELAELDGRDSDDAVRADVIAALLRRAPEDDAIFGIHDVRVRQTAAGLVVNYHCLCDPSLSVASVHSHVDALDHKVKQDCPAISRIVGHAEPQRIVGLCDGNARGRST